MSCWVVPSVAAELWGCSLESILTAIRDGAIASREDNGWTFVDMAPGGPTIDMPRAVQPPTYTAVSREEMAALVKPGADADLAADQYSENTEPEPETAADLVAFVGDEGANDLGDVDGTSDYEQHVYEQQEQPREMSDDWREVRRRVGATRRAPCSAQREAA